MASIINQRFRKQYFNISFKDIKKLVDTRYSCLEEVEHEMNIPLSPEYIGNISQGLKEQLQTNTLFFNHDHLDGVPLAYNKIQVMKSSIVDDQEYISLDVKVNFILFKPEASKILYGTVTKITDHNFGCIFHNCINGSVRRPNESHITEEEKEIARRIHVGDEIHVKVSEVGSHNDILYVLGDLAPQHYRRIRRSSHLYSNNGVVNGKNGTSREQEIYNNNNNNTSMMSLKNTYTVSQSTGTENDTGVSPKKKPEKKKIHGEKTKSEDESTEDYANEMKQTDEISSPTKKKKKKKKSD